jgi:hypothetical protein
MGELPIICRYSRIADSDGKLTPWYSKYKSQPQALPNKILDYVSTHAAAVVLVVSALSADTSATVCYERTRCQATALRHLLPPHIPIILAVTRCDLANAEASQRLMFCEDHWQRFLEVTKLLCGCYEDLAEEEKQILVMAATVPRAEKQQLLRKYKDLAGLLGLLFVELGSMEGSSPSVQQLWQKVAAVASDGVNGVYSSSTSFCHKTQGGTSRSRETPAAAAGGGAGVEFSSGAAAAAGPAIASSVFSGAELNESLLSRSCSSSAGAGAKSSDESLAQDGWVAAIRAAIVAAATRVFFGGGSSSSSRTGSNGSQGLLEGYVAHGTTVTAARRGPDAYPVKGTELSVKGQQHFEGQQQQQQFQSCSSTGQEAPVSSAAVVMGRGQACPEMLYDACGALPCKAEAAGTRNQRPRSDQAVLEVAGWVVLPLLPKLGLKEGAGSP